MNPLEGVPAAHEPAPEALAGYVLRHAEYGAPFPAPGSFYEALIDAAFKADAANLRLLTKVFPGVGVFVSWYRDRVEGRRLLLELAEGRAS